MPTLSALGQKQSFCDARARSALRPKAALRPPEVVKSRRRQFGAAHPVLNVAVTEICLQGPRIVSCERVSIRVSKIPLKLWVGESCFAKYGGGSRGGTVIVESESIAPAR